jgi:hypothetical protein
MAALTDTRYLVLKPEYNKWSRKLAGFNVVAMRQTKPAISPGEIAVKVVLTIDESAFEEYIPVASINIDESVIIAPEVDVVAVPEDDR